jgi:hypothetical protein
MATIAEGYVYWVHLPEHTDMATEGYIGITNNTAERFRIRSGMYNSGSLHITRAVKKHGDSVVYEVLLKSSYEYCKYIENKLRPSYNLGWNIAIGGGVSPSLGKKCSENYIKALKKDNSKRANIYDYKTNQVVAKDVIISEWAENNNCVKSCLSRTATNSEGRKQHKGFYVRYIKE